MGALPVHLNYFKHKDFIDSNSKRLYRAAHRLRLPELDSASSLNPISSG